MNYGATYLFAMLVAWSFGAASLMARARGFGRPGVVAYLVVLAIGLLAAIPIHEAGHWLAGAAQGFRCVRLLLGPVEITRIDSGWRIRLVRLRSLGVIEQVPSSFSHFRLQKATCLAAGPAMSLIACLVFTRLAIRAEAAFTFWFWTANAQMCLSGVLQLIPMRFGPVESDGVPLWKLIRGGLAVDAIERDLLADSVNHTMLRPRDWPTALMRRLSAGASRYNLYLAYIHALDSDHISAAGSHLEQVLESWTGADGAQYALETAYFLAFHRGDVLGARQWLSREPRLRHDAMRLRAEAAVEFAAGHENEAQQLIQEAQLKLRAMRPTGNREFELDCLNAMREEIAARSVVRPRLIEVRHWEPLPVGSLADSATC